jgi:hypothetical protein
MAIGDDALNAGMEIVDGNSTLANTLDDEVNKTRDYIAQRTSAVTPVSKGGTGAGTAEAARANLGIPEIAPGNTAEGNKLPTYNAGGQLTSFPPSLGAHVATKAYVDSRPASPWGDNGSTVSPNGNRNIAATGHFTTTGGSFYSPAAYQATSSYTVAYIDGDGRLAKGASSERYKKFVSEIDPATLGDIWPDLVRYQMRNGDGSWKYGYIAERLDESDDLRPFVVYADLGTGPIPDSIDFIALLMAQNAQLNERLSALESEHASD